MVVDIFFASHGNRHNYFQGLFILFLNLNGIKYTSDAATIPSKHSDTIVMSKISHQEIPVTAHDEAV